MHGKIISKPSKNETVLQYDKRQVLVDQWKKLQHANLIALRQVFTTKTFNDHSMVFVYDFYPGAETLMSKHFNAPTQMSNAFMDPYG